MLPKSPIYIPSKSRWQYERRLTVRALDKIGVPYQIVVEESQYSAYADVIDPSRILVLDPAYQCDYDTCDDLGDSKSKGSGPVRNFIWDHAKADGHAWHWIMDDNINGFCRLNSNAKICVSDGSIFRAMEAFCERYENVAMAGPSYRFFVNNRKQAQTPFLANTRIYSCNLIRNDVPFRWRGRYNEDTILSLDMLKAGWCTIQFNAFLQNKIVTQAVRGGNTDELYQEGTLAKSQMQVAVHPDVSRLVWKFGRWHHHVDYRRFKKNKLRLKPGIDLSALEPNEYGMKLVRLDTGQPVQIGAD
jgi:hypothetical protein